MKKVQFLLILLLLAFSGQAQKAMVCGLVKEKTGGPLIGATVYVQEEGTGAFTDENGRFCLSTSQSVLKLKVSAVGFETTEYSWNGEGSLEIELKTSDNVLDEVKVSGNKELANTRKQAYFVSALNVKKLQNSSQNMNQLLNRITGVKVREEGGLGSRASFSLNGFTGRQVKFFIDGVPMDNFGSSLSINNLPVNLAERIDVYKGVVPIELGSDALGGAVNIITNKQNKKYLDLAYQVGSFNTHRLSLVGSKTFDNGFVLKANAFVNHSDNDYKVKIQLPDPETGKYGPEQKIRRFHDAYDSQAAQVSLGVQGKNWADLFLVGLMASQNKKEVQTGMNMEQVVGQVFNSSHSFIPTLKYRKENLAIAGLDFTLNANYSFVNTSITDTSSRKYDWAGNYTVKTFGSNKGEISYYKTLFTFDDRNALVNGLMSFSRDENHTFSLSHTFSKARRQGEDPLSLRPIAFEESNFLTKQITGLAYKYGTVDSRFSATLFTKMFLMKGYTIDADYWEDFQEGFHKSYTRFGYGTALNYRITPAVRVKTSYENTWRLPEGEEMFGNGLLLENNPQLRPEHSHNVNLGINWSRSRATNNLSAELNWLYRLSSDFIRLESDGQTSRYSNLDSVRTWGAEAAFHAGLLHNRLNLDLNATYQDIKNVNRYESGVESFVYGDRLPNIPYFFGNLNAGYQWRAPFAENDVLNFGWGMHYVHEFYLFWPSQGSASSKFVIPQQISQNLYVSYSFKENKMNVSAECNNLTDADLYDNFRLQKPGRAFNLKLRYFIN
ncbi:TonB-dependent receptor [Marinilongibacter aquaticus]|uniref:TonB-dependent receptor n=1 Tax=Marinilongibacter aquaticus TaxID=2975157 RepID=UPI0021BDB93B|nr:TonB-dependent receptor [Marinilongibacter aquaticus]UBM60426.1 TonB-dependent receptor [Marinilongibacter aquaticus]